jgi:hypothetical protein
MDIEHFGCLSWFLDKRESHEQDGETLLGFATTSRIQAASSDPAMAIRPSSDAYGQWPVALIGSLAAGQMAAAPDSPPTKRAGLPARRFFNGGYPAVQSNLCNALHWHAEDSRESGGVATQASTSRGANDCL